MVSVVRNGQMGPSRKVSGRRTIGTARASLCGPRASTIKRVLGLKI